MKLHRSLYATAVLASLLTPALSISAYAQNETPGGVKTLSQTAPKPAHRPKPVAATETDRVEQHITRLHAQLKITPDQQAPWDQFAQVMRDNAHTMDQAVQQRGTGLASMSAADDMQSYAQLAQMHAEGMQKLSAAFQTLYASMTDAQKKNADMVFHARAAHSRHAKG